MSVKTELLTSISERWKLMSASYAKRKPLLEDENENVWESFVISGTTVSKTWTLRKEYDHYIRQLYVFTQFGQGTNSAYTWSFSHLKTTSINPVGVYNGFHNFQYTPPVAEGGSTITLTMSKEVNPLWMFFPTFTVYAFIEMWARPI